MKIPFNKPEVVGKELTYIQDAVSRGHLSGNGFYVQKCQQWFEEKYDFKKCLLTTSCTDALEMCALLLDIKPGDEVIMPTYTFVSTANAFALRGAEIVFIDSKPNHPNMDIKLVEAAITKKTKAVVAIHYAGVNCDIEDLQALCRTRELALVEDAAQAIDSFVDGKALGTFGDLATFSFHETKNVQCGEGGMLAINNNAFAERAEILWEKGTNRQAFYRGQVDKYRWVDLGSSFLLSDLNAAYLWGQLEEIETITAKRLHFCNLYNEALVGLAEAGKIKLPVEEYLSPNGHLFYLLTKDTEEREALIDHLRKAGILSVFHYQCLHLSPFYLHNHPKNSLPNAQAFEDLLLRLPVYYSLTDSDVKMICESIISFYN